MRISRPIAYALRLSVAEGSLHSIYWSIVAGVIINGLALALGARPIHLAILNGLPLLSQVFGLPFAILIQSRDIRKKVTLVTEAVSRMVWLLIPIAYFLFPTSLLGIWFILIIAGFSHIVHAGGAVGWISWVSDLVPEQIRGVYFGVRNALAGFVGTIGLTIASGYADGVHETFGEGPEYLRSLILLILVSTAFAAASWFGLYLQPVRRMRKLVTTGWTAVWDTLRTPNGRRIAIAWITFAFAIGVTTGVYIPYMLDRLHMPMVSVAVYGWVALIISTIFTPLWGRISDRFGYRNVLIVSWLGIFWLPLLFVFTSENTPTVFMLPWPILVDALIGGTFWPAFSLAQTNLVIAEAPSETRAGLFSALSALAGLSGFISATLAGVIAESIGVTGTIDIFGFALSDLKTPMVIGTVLRLATGFLILTVKEPPRLHKHVTTSEAFAAVWRMLLGKPYRPVR